MTTPVARRQAEIGGPPPGWLLSALADLAGNTSGGFDAVFQDLDTGDPTSVGAARDFAAMTLKEWSALELLFDTQIIISELVTNAMRYAGGTVQLCLICSGAELACTVNDASDEIPVVGAVDYFAESGRGLQLVQALTSAWGWLPLNGQGKLVWAVMPRLER